jgi:hypothetical protein
MSRRNLQVEIGLPRSLRISCRHQRRTWRV